ncbi:unnamed protein product [Bursaphelenchus okinawaensis]|uniref:Dynactin subunit 2 n=1 Tax=Bursaphelenchus okinawaensis TaxID=465554 RepID=A0A811KWN0_9BILA|nr:unnamed protein product [Bursaphelenchus okinawaensis]CAG9112504.1 unnamed protein product [Bursaphelenchus okinawaensis]
MVIKKPVITVYESDPITVEKEVVEKRFVSNVANDSPRMNLSPDDSVQNIDTNFSDFVEKFNRVMLHESEKGYQSYPSDSILTSKPASQRLSELEEEVLELEKELETNSDFEITSEHLNSLKKLVENAKLNMNKTVTAYESEAKQRKQLPEETVGPSDIALLSERVSRIITRLGADTNNSNAFLRPLSLMVEELLVRLESFTTQSKAEINTELTATLTQLQEFNKNSANESHQKVNELHDILQKWNTECQVLPQLLKHLRRCAKLSEHAEDMLRNAENLSQTFEESQKLLQNLSASNSFQNTVTELEKIQKML